jgi:ABC-type uncharacterized transport system substrate-binding protein
MSYSSGTLAGFRHAGTYVAKILGATNPGDLPIEQASKFIFVINLKTIKGSALPCPDLAGARRRVDRMSAFTSANGTFETCRLY